MRGDEVVGSDPMARFDISVIIKLHPSAMIRRFRFRFMKRLDVLVRRDNRHEARSSTSSSHHCLIALEV